MRNAETILAIIRNRGLNELPVEDVYRLLYNSNLYLCAYGKLYKNQGAMTKGITEETADGMTLKKIDNIIELLRYERYRWTPVRRTYIPKKNKKLRALSLPIWSDKLLQEVIRLILEAYYEPQFSKYSHGFRPNRWCHTALKQVVRIGTGTTWFIEGDISSCFDKIDHTILIDTIKEKIRDNRFIRLLDGLLKAGYLEDWKYNATHSGVPAGGVVSPILSNIMLNRFDQYVEKHLIPAYTRGQLRKDNPAYEKLKRERRKLKKQGDWRNAKTIMKQMQMIPSQKSDDPAYKRLWFVRYADDFLLGYIGTKNEAVSIRQEISDFLQKELKLELNVNKTLITHARTEKAKFLSYEIHTIQCDSKHCKNGKRNTNGAIGLRVPSQVVKEKCAKYMRYGKPIHMPQRINNETYNIVAQYQAEYRGIVQYYKMAYNLCSFSKLDYVTRLSLAKTLAAKYKTTCASIFYKYGTKIKTKDGEYKVILVEVKREIPKKPLTTYFGGVSLKWDKVSYINDNIVSPIIISKMELIKRLTKQECELCGSRENIEVHHIHKLADLKHKKRTQLPAWKKWMITKARKTIVVCRKCHGQIHSGKYDGRNLSHE